MTCNADLEARLAALEGQFSALTGKLSGKSVLIATYGNENFQERCESIPIRAGSGQNIYRRLMLAKSGPVRAGDSFLAFAEFEVTSPYAYNCMIGSQIWVSDGASWGGAEVTEANAMNFRGDEEHHYTRTKIGLWAATANYDFRYFNLFAWAASEAASSGHSLKVEQDYGRLVVMHFRRFEDL